MAALSRELPRKLGLPAPGEVTLLAVEAADCVTVGGAMDPRVAAALRRVLTTVEAHFR